MFVQLFLFIRRAKRGSYCQLKRNTQPKSCELRCIPEPYWRLYSPGDSLSDSSEELFQRSKGGARISRSFCWKKKKLCSWTSKDYCWSQKNRHFKLTILVLFYVWEGARVQAHWNDFLDMYLHYLGPASCFSPSWIPPRVPHTARGGYSGWWLGSILFTGMAGSAFCPH